MTTSTQERAVLKRADHHATKYTHVNCGGRLLWEVVPNYVLRRGRIVVEGSDIMYRCEKCRTIGATLWDPGA